MTFLFFSQAYINRKYQYKKIIPLVFHFLEKSGCTDHFQSNVIAFLAFIYMYKYQYFINTHIRLFSGVGGRHIKTNPKMTFLFLSQAYINRKYQYKK